MVEALPAHNPNINAQDEDGRTPLHHAISLPSRPRRDIIDMLLQHGADANILDNNTEPLLTTVLLSGSHSVEDVQSLLKYGADVHARDSSGRTALHVAIRRQVFEIKEARLRNSVGVNAGSDRRGTLLFVATSLAQSVSTMFVEVVLELLLEHGFNVNAVDRWNDTALRIAVESGWIALIRVLLVYGADVYRQKEGAPSIMEIAHGKPGETITRLLTYFADVPPYERVEAARTLEQEEWWKDLVRRDTVL